MSHDGKRCVRSLSDGCAVQNKHKHAPKPLIKLANLPLRAICKAGLADREWVLLDGLQVKILVKQHVVSIVAGAQLTTGLTPLSHSLVLYDQVHRSSN